uniref:RRM domain-containing protein n=1 Tax=Mycena chlorophos TaxID=658473 RepID=A0ABQ0KZ85_MYCCL|nr:predicted protein [Mycena chlorophos]
MADVSEYQYDGTRVSLDSSNRAADQRHNLNYDNSYVMTAYYPPPFSAIPFESPTFQTHAPITESSPLLYRGRSSSPSRTPAVLLPDIHFSERSTKASLDKETVRTGQRTNPGNNLHVSPLVRSLTSHVLEGIFSRVGRVSNCEVLRDPHTHESRGFAFVTMDSPEEADAAIAALNGTVLEEVVLRVTKARRGRARTPTPGTYRGPLKPERRRSCSRSRSRSPARRRGGSPAYHREYRPQPYDSRYRDRDRDSYHDRNRGSRYEDRPGRRDERDYREPRGYDRERKRERDDCRGRGGQY